MTFQAGSRTDDPTMSDSGGDSSKQGGRWRRTLEVSALGLGVLTLAVGLAWAIRDRLERRREGAPVVVVVPGGGGPGVDQVRAGKLVYQVHCGRCHGPWGRGDGPDALLLPPAPGDFTIGPWKHGETADAVRKVILDGVPGTAMAGWRRSLSPRQLDVVVDYVRTLGPRRTADGPPSPLERQLRHAGFVPADRVEEAPRLWTEDLEGMRESLLTYRGSVVVLVFWGTSCPPCLEEFPSLERVAEEFRAAGLVVLPVCVDESDLALVQQAARGKADRLRVLVDRFGRSRIRFDVQTLPTAVLIDRQGRELGRVQGATRWTDPAIRDLLRAALALEETAQGG